MKLKKDNISITEASWLIDAFSPAEIIEMNLLTDISAVIQQQRKRLGYTQKEMASKLGVTQGLVSRWENGEASLTTETIARIAAALSLRYQSPLLGDDTIEHLNELYCMDFTQETKATPTNFQWSMSYGT